MSLQANSTHLQGEKGLRAKFDLEHQTKKAPYRILHVDDDICMQQISKQILVDICNFDIENACCVDEEISKLVSGHYDVIISDYELPQKDGLQFLTLLRNGVRPLLLVTVILYR